MLYITSYALYVMLQASHHCCIGHVATVGSILLPTSFTLQGLHTGDSIPPLDTGPEKLSCSYLTPFALLGPEMRKSEAILHVHSEGFPDLSLIWFSVVQTWIRDTAMNVFIYNSSLYQIHQVNPPEPGFQARPRKIISCMYIIPATEPLSKRPMLSPITLAILFGYQREYPSPQ